MKKTEEKFILDACCGKRMMWFNKQHPNVLFLDNRKEVGPDMVGDFRNLGFKDNSFKLVVWDPPHIIQGSIGRSIIAKSYGILNPETWREDLRDGFEECYRVLEDKGILIFKWSDCNKWANISRGCNIKTVLELFDKEPLFGHKTKSKFNIKEDKQISATYWFCFMKI
jgi:SAM-dependent methyltransferase